MVWQWVKHWFKRPRYWMIGMAIALLVISCQRSAVVPDGVGTVTLKLSGWGGNPTEQALLEQVLRDFEASHPQIEVRFEAIADQYMDVMRTRLIGDAAPDVFYLDALEAPFLMDKGVLEPLNSYIPPTFDLTDFEPALLRPFTLQEEIYGLPKDFSTLALFYNQQAFAEAGLSRPPRTWAELREFSRRLTVDRDGDGKPEQYGFGVVAELPRQMFMVQAFGGKVIDERGYAAFASEVGLQGLQQVVEQYRGDRTSAQKSDVGTNSGVEMLGQGKVAMVIEGNWAIPYLQDTFPDLAFATAEVPTLNGKPGTMAYTVAYVMNRQSRHKAAAWELIAYLTGKVGMEKWTGMGFALPTRKSVAERLRYDTDPLRAALVAGVAYATPWQIGQYPTLIMNNFDNQFVSAMLGQQPLPEAMQTAQTAANKQIAAVMD